LSPTSKQVNSIKGDEEMPLDMTANIVDNLLPSSLSYVKPTPLEPELVVGAALAAGALSRAFFLDVST